MTPLKYVQAKPVNDMAHEDALNMCRTALAHLNNYMTRLNGQLWGDYHPPENSDPMVLLNQARDELGAYISRIARVDEQADVVVMFDGARLPVQVKLDDGEAYPSHVHINGEWIDVAETWLSFGPVGTRFDAAVRHALRKQAKIDAAP
jgi:hypothetical protein